MLLQELKNIDIELALIFSLKQIQNLHKLELSNPIFHFNDVLKVLTLSIVQAKIIKKVGQLISLHVSKPCVFFTAATRISKK